jgi:hypothetical protein
MSDYHRGDDCSNETVHGDQKGPRIRCSENLMESGKPFSKKYGKYQRADVNRIKHFLPRTGENPDYTVHGQLESWNSSRANTDISVDIPTDFPQRIVDIYKVGNEKYKLPIESYDDAGIVHQSRILPMLAEQYPEL